MNAAAVISIIAIVLGIVGAIVSHIIISVWWASKISTTLDFVRDALKEVKDHQNGYYAKEDAIKEQSKNEMQHAALWKRLDDLKIEIDKIKGATR